MHQESRTILTGNPPGSNLMKLGNVTQLVILIESSPKEILCTVLKTFAV